MSLFSMDESSVWGKGSSLFNISSPLNDLLEKDDFTLEQVLEEDELIQEVKTRNTKLLEFLSQEQSVLKMIEYVVRTPEDPSDDMRTLKYPYMSCEVICCDIMSITETLASASNGKIVETMFEFLYQTEPLDPRLAGYFEKIMSMLMVRKPQEMTALMNKHSEELLEGFVAHASSFSIAELLKRLLQPYHSDYMDDMDFPGMSMGFPPANAWYGGGDDDDASVGTPTSGAGKTLAWQHEPRVVDLLIANLVPVDGGRDDSDTHKHSAEVLVDIIHCGSRAQQSDPASPASGGANVSLALLEYLESPPVVDALLGLAVPTQSYTAASMTAALSVLSALLSRHTNARYAAGDELPPVVAATLARIPHVVRTLRGEDHDAGTLRTQRRQDAPRLGLRRLKLVGLLVLLMQSKYHKVDAVLLKENVVDVCLDLFFTFENNNMLHADVESMVVGILESGGPDLLTALIPNARLLARILDAHARNEAATASAKGNSLGFMGHLHRICNLLLSLAEDARGSAADARSLHDMTHADAVLELLEADAALWARWEELASKVLAPLYERERLPLGGVSIASGGDDPYGGFAQSDEILNAQFAEMLGASGFGAASNDFDTYFDLKTASSNDTPMLPEIMNDSSSSEDEDDDARFGGPRNGDDDGFDFDPRGAAAAFPASTGGADPSTDATDRWASFEASGAWAAFDDAGVPATDFTAAFDSAPMDESEIMSESPTAAAVDELNVAVAAVAIESETTESKTETTTTVTTTETTTTTVVTETETATAVVDVSSVEVSVAAVEGEAAAAAPAATEG